MNAPASGSKKKKADEPTEAPEQTPPGPLRPIQGATNSKLAPPPPVADQPGLGRAANPAPPPGPLPNLGTDRVGAAVTAAKERASADAEAAAQG